MDELTALAAAETAPLDETTPNGELVSLSQNFFGRNLRVHDIEHLSLLLQCRTASYMSAVARTRLVKKGFQCQTV